MSHIHQLIQQLCPNGVPYMKLGEVCILSRGKVYSKKYLAEEKNQGEYPVYSSQTANNGELGRINTYEYDGEYITWTTDGAYAGTVFYRSGKFSITNVCGLITLNTDKLSLRFLYYWLGIKAKEYVYQGMGNPKLMSNQMAPIPIPVPPLAVQEAIVSILDRYSRLAAELQAELQARRLQYEYYRNALLTFSPADASVTWLKLGEVCKILDSKRIPIAKNKRVSGIYPYYGANGIQDYVDNYIFDGTFLLMGEDGSVINSDRTPVLNWAEGKIWVNNHAHILSEKEGYSLRYLYYTLQTIDISPFVRGIPPKLTQESLVQISIPVPSMEEQSRIVGILDKFERLISDFSEGIPAEQQALQQQYEYYRNKLLVDYLPPLHE